MVLATKVQEAVKHDAHGNSSFQCTSTNNINELPYIHMGNSMYKSTTAENIKTLATFSKWVEYKGNTQFLICKSI